MTVRSIVMVVVWISTPHPAVGRASDFNPDAELEPDPSSMLLPLPPPTLSSPALPSPELPWLAPVGVAKALLASITGVPAPEPVGTAPLPVPSPAVLDSSVGYTVIVIVVVLVLVTRVVPDSPSDGAAVT